MPFDSYLAKIKTHLESHGVYIMFLEGDYNLGCPPFGCNFEESVQATIPPSQVPSGKNLAHGQGMCGSVSGSIPANVGQPMIRVSEITVGGR